MKIGRYEVTWYQTLAVVLTLLLLCMIITRIFGHSATDIMIIMTAFSTFGTWIYNLEKRTSGIEREVGELKTHVQHGFANVKKDVSEIKENLSELKLLIRKRGK